MKVRELIGRLRELEPEAEVRLQLGSRDFAPSAWVGIMDTAGLFDEERIGSLLLPPGRRRSISNPEAIWPPKNGRNSGLAKRRADWRIWVEPCRTRRPFPVGGG